MEVLLIGLFYTIKKKRGNKYENNKRIPFKLSRRYFEDI